MEDLQGIHLLAARNELQRLIDYRTDRDGGTTSRIAIELREHHAVEVEAVVELLGRVYSILTRHRIHDEEGLRGVHGSLDGGNLLHHRLVHGQTTGRIDDNHVVGVLTCVLDSVLGDLDGVHVTLLGVDLDTHLLTQDLELVDSGRTIDVAGHEQHLTALLRLDQLCQLAREGRLTRTLQTGDQHHGGRAFELDVGCRATHELSQLVAHDLGHHLTRLDGLQHILTHCLLLYLGGKVLGYLIVYVGIEQCLAYILQRFRYIDFGDFAFTFQNLKRPFQSFT